MHRLRAVIFAIASVLALPVSAQQPSTVSGLPYASTPFGGSELLYIIQGGVSKKTPASAFGTTIVPGLTPITGTCANGSNLFSNSGVVGCQANGTAILVNAQTGTTYPVAPTDNGKLVTFSNASSTAVSLPQAIGLFAAPFCWSPENKGVGTVTITPTISTINGASSLSIPTSQGVLVCADNGGNWQIGYAGLFTVSGSVGSAGSGLTLTGSTFKLGDAGLTYASNILGIGTLPTPGGLVLTGFQPNATGNPGDTLLAQLNCNAQAIGNVHQTPSFSDANCLELNQFTVNMDAVFSGTTSAKTTTATIAENSVYYGSGQSLQNIYNIHCYKGKSDCAQGTTQMFFGDVPIAGDEGTGFSDVNLLSQFQSLTLASITASGAQSTCNATATQAISKSATPQAITVTINSGACNVGDWIMVGQDVPQPQGLDNKSPAQITATGSGTITAQIRANYAINATITPAVVLTLSTGFQIGQNRVLVDLSQPTYSTGTVTTTAGVAGFVGSGTNWSTSMVGGNATNIGCIAFANDTFTGAAGQLFGGTGINGPLQSYYQITGVQDATHATLYSTSLVGNAGYTGIPGAGQSYVIYPCAEIEYLGNTNGIPTGVVVLESSTSTWAVSDNVEAAIGPYPSVVGSIYNVSGYTPGGLWGPFMSVTNIGATQWSSAFNISARQPTGSLKTPGWLFGFTLNDMGTAIQIGSDTTVAAIQMQNVCLAGNNLCGMITWGGNYIRPNTANAGMDFQAAAFAGGLLQTISAGSSGGLLSGSVNMLLWPGMIKQTAVALSSYAACGSGSTQDSIAAMLSGTTTWGAPVTAGSNRVIAHCNGTNWTVMGD